jgi:hypothetical protein
LIIAVSVVVVIMVLSGALGWRFLAHRGSARQLMRADWRTRRRVGIALKKGRPIQPADRGTAQATIDYHRSHGWVCWIWLGVGLVWLMNTALAHGNRRWFDLALATFYFAFIPYWVRLRKKILSRETEIVMPDPPQNPVATAPIQT